MFLVKPIFSRYFRKLLVTISAKVSGHQKLSKISLIIIIIIVLIELPYYNIFINCEGIMELMLKMRLHIYRALSDQRVGYT
jgi:hypothetical protein